MQLLNFPLCVMRFSQFKALGKLVPHEEARDGGQLRILDQWQDAMAFARSHPICFISHQWLGLATPDPKNVHYPGMVEAGACRQSRPGLPPHPRLPAASDGRNVPEIAGPVFAGQALCRKHGLEEDE